MKLITLVLTLIGVCSNAWSVGALFVRPLNSTATYQTMYIKSYDVKVSIQDHVAITSVDQVCVNTLNQTVESTFIFPLPEGAIITELYYWFNGVRYKGSVREKKEAQAAYDAKIKVRIDPALLQEIGDNVFKLNIAPIAPNSDVRFEIIYTEILPFELGKSTYLHYLKTTGLSPKPLSRLSLTINAITASEWKEVNSPSYANSPAHRVEVVTPAHVKVTLGDEEFVPTKDYKLELRTKRTSVEINALTYTPVAADSFGIDPFFLTWVIPPDEDVLLTPRSIVFVADVSSSMEGRRMENLREALRVFLSNLNSTDRFNIVTFSTGTTSFKPDLVAATNANIAAATKFVNSISALGLTNISDALWNSMNFSYAEATQQICVFLTDGEPSWGITNELQILDSLAKWNTHTVRIYPISIGTQTKISLLKEIAKRNSGFLTEIANDDSIAVMVRDHIAKISLPQLTDLHLNYGQLIRHDVVPAVLPNVLVGGRVVQSGRYNAGGLFPVTLDYKLSDAKLSVSKDVLFGDPVANNRAVAKLWAQAKISELLSEIARYGEKKELVDAIIDLSIRFEILTKYTALYADPDDKKTATGFKDPDRPIEDFSISVAPNPVDADANLVIRTDGAFVNVEIEVWLYDMLGRAVAQLYRGPTDASMQIRINFKNINGASLSAGMYNIVATVGTARRVYTIVVR
ncbi:MAG: VWA domain-containing protein [Ignavibacteria bacterium]|nr:VWA domain-containing protein [Ignavibacteria bacterium]